MTVAAFALAACSVDSAGSGGDVDGSSDASIDAPGWPDSAAGSGATSGAGGTGAHAGSAGADGGGQGGALDAGTGGTAGAGTGGTAGAAGASGTAGTGGALACDSRFSFGANPALAGVPFDVRFTDDPGYVYVAMDVAGPGAPVTSWVGVSGTPHTWTWTVSGHGAGVLAFTFLKDRNGSSTGTAIATCSIASLDAPP